MFNDSSLLKAEEILKINLIPVCSDRHALAALKGKVADRELALHPQVIMSNTVKSSRRSAGVINPDNVISVQDYLTKKELIMSGLGWGRMPEHLIKAELKSGLLVGLSKKAFVVQAHIAKHSQKELGPCVQFLWDWFLKEKL